MPQPRIMFYHDGRHPLIYMYEPPMQKEEYESAVDELVGTPVEVIMFCLGDGRTVLHDTQVGELWGHNMKKWPHIIFRRAHQNARNLIRKGHDPLRLICDRAHEKGMLVYPTLLVQQGRGDRSQDVRCSNFRFENSHLEIGAGGDLAPDFPGSTHFDFKHEEVRNERLALIEETVNKYPVDGFELNLNYSGYYFHPKEIEQGLPIMTEWIQQVHKAVKKSGADRELAIRVSASVQSCMRVGLDVKTWITQGIVDVLIGQDLGGPELLDQMTDFRSLVDVAKGTKTRVHATIHSNVDSDRLAEGPIEMIRAAACNAWAQGVDGLYLAHWFSNWPYQASFYEKLRELPNPDVMGPKDKFYFVATGTQRYPTPTPESGIKMQLPASVRPNQPIKIRFNVTDEIARWHHVGRVHEVLLRIRIMEMTERDQFRFCLNSKELPDELLRTINEMYRETAPRYRAGFGYWSIYRLDRGHWPRKGRNTLEVTLLKRDPEVITDITLRDVEIEVKYLMGKNFHRGQDVDLGPYENVV